LEACERLDQNASEWALDQNDYGAPAQQTWVLMPTARPQVDILDSLQFPLRVSGRHVIDSAGQPLKLVGVNWIGAHMEQMVNNGLNYVTMKHMAKYIRHMGFNHVRMNYALAMLHAPGQPLTNKSKELPKVPNPSVLKANPDLVGLSALEVFDKCIEALTDEGVLVILNNHMSDAGWCCTESDGNGMWWNENYTTSDWLDALTFLSQRYAGNPRVFGHDIRNEPRPDLRPELTPGSVPWWGLETELFSVFGYRIFDWRIAASRGAVAVWKGDPEMNVIVEGVWFASNLAYVEELPLNLAQDCLKSKVFYSLHEYPWFSMIYGIWDYAINPFMVMKLLSDIKNLFDTEEWTDVQKQHPGSEQEYPRFKEFRVGAGWNLVEENIAPIWVSEVGTDTRGARRWYNNTLKFFREVDADWCWWPVDVDKIPVDFDPSNPEGLVDGSGIFNPGYRDYKSVVGWKLQDLISIQAPGPGYPKQVPVPEKCTFDLQSNLEAAAAPTDNFKFLATIHWSWWMILWALLLLLVLTSPLVVCCGCMYCCYKRKPAKVGDIDENEGLLPKKDWQEGVKQQSGGGAKRGLLQCC